MRLRVHQEQTHLYISGGNALTGEIELFAVHSARVRNWLNKCFAGRFHGNQRTCTLHYANGGLRSAAELFISRCIMLISTCIYFPTFATSACGTCGIFRVHIASSADRARSPAESQRPLEFDELRLIPLNRRRTPKHGLLKRRRNGLKRGL
jgi:hypothetical protein